MKEEEKEENKAYLADRDNGYLGLGEPELVLGQGALPQSPLGQGSGYGSGV